jgi:fructoselysine-6-P-deglycase FrlB-like protein
MMTAVELYEALASAPDDRSRAKLIAEAFERLEERYPHLPELATQGHVRESELRLQKEIEKIRAELITRIEQVRAELKADIAHTKADLLKWIVPLMLAQVAAIAALVKLL